MRRGTTLPDRQHVQHDNRNVRLHAKLHLGGRRRVWDCNRQSLPGWTCMRCRNHVPERNGVRERSLRLRAKLPCPVDSRMRSGDCESLCRRTCVSHWHHLSEWSILRLGRVPVCTFVRESDHGRMRNTHRKSLSRRPRMRGRFDVPCGASLQQRSMLHTELPGDARMRRNDVEWLWRHMPRHNMSGRQRVQCNIRHVRVRSVLSSDGSLR